MSHLIISEYGRFLGKKSERLAIFEKGKVIEEYPLRDISQVTISTMGVSLSADALAACTEFGIPINFLTSAGKPYAVVSSPELTGTVITRREQLKAYDDERGVHLAKCFVAGKINNQACLIKYYAKHRRESDSYEELMDKAKAIESLKAAVKDVTGNQVDEIRTTLLNLEGRAAAIYWPLVGQIAVGEEFSGREHRGATDPFNSCLNYGYGILYNQVWGSVVLAGLEPFGGFLHVDRPGKPSLVLDLVEEFRAPSVDRAVVSLMVRGWRPEFDDDGGLTTDTRRTIAAAVTERLDGTERYEGKKWRLSQVILAQSRSVASYVRRQGQYKPFHSTW
jgi:CRISPR-associated protein Cas1